MNDSKKITEELRAFERSHRILATPPAGGVARPDHEEQADRFKRAADTIDALVREMHARELHHFEVAQDRDALVAVVEKVRGVIGAEIGWESPAILIGRIQWALSTAPADALAEHDRQVAERAWEEGARWAAVEFGKDAFEDESRVGLVPSDNPHRKETRS